MTQLVNLSALADQINSEHRQCEQALASALNHAYNCGVLLMQAKQNVPYGQWGKWLETSCAVGPRMAQNYMKVAANYSPETLPADGSIREAIAALAEPKTKRVSEVETPKPWEKENFKKHCQLWSDYWKAWVYLMMAMEMTPQTIATLTGKTEGQVKRAVMPEFPKRFQRQGTDNLADLNSIFDRDGKDFVEFYETSQKGSVYKEIAHSYRMAETIAQRDYPELADTLAVQRRQAETLAEWNQAPYGAVEAFKFLPPGTIHWLNRSALLPVLPTWGISPAWEVLVKTQTNGTTDDIGPALFCMCLEDMRYAMGTTEKSPVDDNPAAYLLHIIDDVFTDTLKAIANSYTDKPKSLQP